MLHTYFSLAGLSLFELTASNLHEKSESISEKICSSSESFKAACTLTERNGDSKKQGTDTAPEEMCPQAGCTRCPSCPDACLHSQSSEQRTCSQQAAMGSPAHHAAPAPATQVAQSSMPESDGLAPLHPALNIPLTAVAHLRTLHAKWGVHLAH